MILKISIKSRVRVGSFFWVCVAVWLSSSLAYAKVKAVELPKAYGNFAMNPETGDVVALDEEGAKAVLFRRADLKKGKAKPADTVSVGSNPSSVCYKQFGDQRLFAVVCLQDSHMYLIDAADFKLLKKIELPDSRVSNVATSRNPKDPFLYYNHGAGHGSVASVVSLRDMKNKGEAIKDSAFCRVSAKGDMVYRLGPWSPSGFESLIRVNVLTDEKPSFRRLFYDHSSKGGYVPGPFGSFTAAGKVIYTASLEKSVATLDFTPYAFFEKEAVVVGLQGTARSFGRPPKELVLQAASYNTFKAIGREVAVELIPAEEKKRRSSRQFRRGAGPKVFADDARKSVVLAYQNAVALVPLSQLNLPDEPFLVAKLKGNKQLQVGKSASLELVPRGTRTKIEIEELPEGMKGQGNQLSWTPGDDAVGTHQVEVTLSGGGVERKMSFDLSVAYPSQHLPFSSTGFRVRKDGRIAICWGGPPLDVHGRPTQHPNAPKPQLAVVDLKTGKVIVQRTLSAPVYELTLVGDNAVLWQRHADPRLEVLRLKDLKRQKSLGAQSQLLDVQAFGGYFALQTRTGIDIYNSKSLERVRTFGGKNPHQHIRNRNANSLVTPHGLFVGGVLYDEQMKPKMVLGHGTLPVISRSMGQVQPPALRALKNQNVPHHMHHQQGTQRLATASMPGARYMITLDRTTSRIQVPGSVHTSRQQAELVVRLQGDVSKKQVLKRGIQHQQTGNHTPPPRPTMQTASGRVYVLDDRELYEWSVPGPSKSQQRLSWNLQQSVLSISGSGKTELKHATEGGKSPVTYTLANEVEGMSFDEKTGTLSIDNDVMLKVAQKSFEDYLIKVSRNRSLADTYRELSPAMKQQTVMMLGRKSKGIAVALPIRLTASDSTLETLKIEYYVVVELPKSMLRERLAKLEVEHAKRLEEQSRATKERQQSRQGRRPSGGNDAALARRVEVLEQQVQLLTRQLNALMKELERRDAEKE